MMEKRRKDQQFFVLTWLIFAYPVILKCVLLYLYLLIKLFTYYHFVMYGNSSFNVRYFVWWRLAIQPFPLAVSSLCFYSWAGPSILLAIQITQNKQQL